MLDRFVLLEMPKDRALLIAALLLMLLGVVMVTSASLQIGEARLGAPFYFAARHSMFLALAVFVGVATYVLVPFSLLQRLRYVALFSALLALIMVLIPGVGREVNGSQRWISLMGFNIQPSELAKLGFLIYLAGYIDERKEELGVRWGAFMRPLVLLLAVTFLLLLEPDFGAVVVISLAALGMLFLSGVPTLRFLLIALMAALLAAGVAVSQPYRMARLMSFLDPWADQFGGGYQLTQSLIAFGRGGIDGVGLGNSVQKLFYLPEAHTDFVFAVTAEEFGLLGSLLVLSLFALLCGRIFMTALKLLSEKDWFGGQLVLGIGLVLSSQVVINIGVNMGLLPTKGLTLPLISYGGSSLLVSVVMVALVLRAEKESGESIANARPARRGRQR